jgi:hypothetical protein
MDYLFPSLIPAGCLGFLDANHPVWQYAPQLLHFASRPTDFDQIYRCISAQTEVYRAGTR